MHFKVIILDGDLKDYLILDYLIILKILSGQNRCNQEDCDFNIKGLEPHYKLFAISFKSNFHPISNIQDVWKLGFEILRLNAILD